MFNEHDYIKVNHINKKITNFTCFFKINYIKPFIQSLLYHHRHNHNAIFEIISFLIYLFLHWQYISDILILITSYNVLNIIQS